MIVLCLGKKLHLFRRKDCESSKKREKMSHVLRVMMTTCDEEVDMDRVKNLPQRKWKTREMTTPSCQFRVSGFQN